MCLLQFMAEYHILLGISLAQHIWWYSPADDTSEHNKKNKEERYSQVPRLSDTRNSANGTKGKWRYASSIARLKCSIYGYVGGRQI